MVYNNTNKPRGIVKPKARYGLTVSDFRLTWIFFAGTTDPSFSSILIKPHFTVYQVKLYTIQKLDLVVATPLQMFINILLIQGNLSSIEPACN